MVDQNSIPLKELERWHQAPEVEPGIRFVKIQLCNTLEVTMDFADFLEEVHERLSRWREGHYTLKEAAQVLSEAYPGKINADSFYKQLEKAIQRGKLVIREHGVRIEQEDLPQGRLGRHAIEVRDFNEWLKNEGSPYRLSYPYSDSLTTGQAQADEEKFVPKSAQQKDLILQCLERKGYTPSDLPSRVRGKSGPKSEVKVEMLKIPRMFTEKSFEKAWEGLRADGSILGAD